MSRTDKDNPRFISPSGWYKPRHYCSRNNPCTLPDLNSIKYAREIIKISRSRCFWYVHHSTYEWYLQFGRPPKWFVDHVYHNVMRRDSRDSLRKAIADHRANGDTDVEPEPRQARHSAGWLWD